MPGAQRYISNELTHFVGRGKAGEDQYQLLLKICQSGWLTHPPHNPSITGGLMINANAKLSTNEMYSPQIVCFCDIPVEDFSIHVTKYSPFGLSFGKQFIQKQGGTPVLYIPRQVAPFAIIRQFCGAILTGNPEPERDAELLSQLQMGDIFDHMLGEYHKQIESARGLTDVHTFFAFRLFSYIKFFDSSLADDDPENFYMEREWRVVGNIKFKLDDVQRIVVPSSYGKRLRADVPEFAGQVTFV